MIGLYSLWCVGSVSILTSHGADYSSHNDEVTIAVVVYRGGQHYSLQDNENSNYCYY